MPFNSKSFGRTNFRISPQSPRTPKKSKNLWVDRKTDRHALIIALLFFTGFFMVIIFVSETLVTWLGVSRIFALLAVLFSFMPKKSLPLIYRIRKELKVILALFGLAPFFTGLIFTLNFSFSGNAWKETYPVLKLGNYTNKEVIEVVLPEDKYKRFKHIRRFSAHKVNAFPDSVEYTLQKGIFGFVVIDDATLIINTD